MTSNSIINSNSYLVNFVSELQISSRNHFFLLSDLFFVLSNIFAFYFLIELARTSGTMLTKSGDSGHLCLDCDQKGKIHSSIIKYDFSCRFFIDVLHQFEKFPSFLNLLSFIRNGFCILSNFLTLLR